MKALVFLLVLANLLFYAFGAGYFGHPDNPDAGRVEHQVAPEQMRIVSRGEAPLVPAKPEPEVEAAAPEAEPAPVVLAQEEPELPIKEEKLEKAPVCLVWRQLSVADADRLSGLLADRFKAFKQTRTTLVSAGNGWWVFVPPLPSKADADKKAAELRELGIKDFFVIQEGPNRFAISLGVFSTEKGSQDRLAELKVNGVRSASAGPRPGKDSTVTLQARARSGDKAALLAAVGVLLPKAEAQGCK